MVRFLGYTDRPAIARLGTDLEGGVFFMSSSYALCRGRLRGLTQWVHHWQGYQTKLHHTRSWDICIRPVRSNWAGNEEVLKNEEWKTIWEPLQYEEDNVRACPESVAPPLHKHSSLVGPLETRGDCIEFDRSRDLTGPKSVTEWF